MRPATSSKVIIPNFWCVYPLASSVTTFANYLPVTSTRNSSSMSQQCWPGSFGHSSRLFQPKRLPKCLLSVQASQPSRRPCFLISTWRNFLPGMAERLKHFNGTAFSFFFASRAPGFSYVVLMTHPFLYVFCCWSFLPVVSLFGNHKLILIKIST